MDKSAAFSGQELRCDDCGACARKTTPLRLCESGWTLSRVRDAYGNPVLRWRCPACSSARTQRPLPS